MDVIDLCCGAGGFSEGFRQAGFKIILGVDTDFLAINSFRLNFHCDVWQRDIRQIWSLPKCDVLIGSPPCPHFSEANRGFTGEPDMTIVNDFFRIVEIAKPMFWIMEYVVGILDVIDDWQYQILQANQFGLYHKRARAFIGDFPKVKIGKEEKIVYPTPISSDDHSHTSKNNKHISCLTDYFKFTPGLDVFKEIMGFPRDFIFVGKKKDQIRQIGNAVCPPVAKALAEEIRGDADG